MHRPALLGLLLAGCAPTTSVATPPPGQAAAPVETPPASEVMADAPGPVEQAPPAPAALLPAPGLRKVLEARGWDAVAVPGRVIVLDDDFLHLRALDADTGAELWRAKVQDKAEGRHTLFPVGERVLLFAGPRVIAVDVRDGKVVGAHPAGGYNGGDSGCGLRVVRGVEATGWQEHVPWDSDRVACAVSCQCSLSLLRCDTGAPLASFQGTVTHLYHSLSEPHDNVCWRPPRLIGRVGARTLVALEAAAGDYEAAALVDDTVVWREPALGEFVGRFRPVDGEAASDTCWASGAPDLAVWTCSTGKIRWRAEAGAQDGDGEVRARLLAPGRLLVERRGAARNLVELRALVGGKALWKRSLAADRRILVPGAAVDPPIWDAPTTYTLVDPATGATRAEITVAPRETLWPDPAGGWVRMGAAYTEFNADGRERRAAPQDMSGAAWIGERLVAVGSRERLAVLRRADFAARLDVPGGFVVLASRALGPDALLLSEHRGAEPLRIALLRAE